MPPTAPPNHPNLADHLPADTYYQLIHSLCLTLPPPLTDTPEDLARRNHSAIARIAALAPANAAEADIAALYVAASEQWKDCLRLAQQAETTSYWAQKCRAQANSMMRQTQSALRLLLRMQATRQKLEANSEARDRAAWTEHCAIALMAEALSSPAAAAAKPPASEPQPQPQPVDEPQPDPLAAAEHDAAIPPHSAAPIRPIGRVPDTILFGPPEDDLPQPLLTPRIPAFPTPDRHFAEAQAA